MMTSGHAKMPCNPVDLSSISAPRLANEAYGLVRLVENANEQMAGWLFIMCIVAMASGAVAVAMALVIANDVGVLLPVAVVLVVVGYLGWRCRMALQASSRLTSEWRARERELVKRRGRHG